MSEIKVSYNVNQKSCRWIKFWQDMLLGRKIMMEIFEMNLTPREYQIIAYTSVMACIAVI